jgi:hypothetical protein
MRYTPVSGKEVTGLPADTTDSQTRMISVRFHDCYLQHTKFSHFDTGYYVWLDRLIPGRFCHWLRGTQLHMRYIFNGLDADCNR